MLTACPYYAARCVFTSRLLFGFVAFGLASPAWAQDVRDGDTLPARAGGLIIAPAFSGGTERFGPKFRFFGRESILADFAGISLLESIVGKGAPLEQAKGLLGGDFGVTNFEASQNSVGLNFTLAYGITDRLTVAAVGAWSYASYDIEAWLSSSQPNLPNGGRSYYRAKDRRALVCPTGEIQLQNPDDLFKILDFVGAPYQFNIDDLRTALTSDCFGFKDPFDSSARDANNTIRARGSRNYSGFRDTILGAKYQWFHGEHLHLSSLVYVVMPTGTPDDPDDLFDPSFGDGNWDAALILGATIPLGDFRVGVAAGYEIQFADSLVRRLSGVSFPDELETKLANNEISEQDLYDQYLDDGGSLPIVTAYEKANVSRKLGDNFYLYSTFGYQILEWLGVGMNVDFLYHFRDELTDTGTRVADGTRFKTSAELRAEVDQKLAADIAAGTVPPENEAAERVTRLRAALPSSAERRAAAYGWHTVRTSIVTGFNVQVNTLGPFLRDEFPLPLIVAVNAAIPVAGKNLDAIDSFGLTLTIPFITGEVKDPAEYGYDDDPEPGRGLPWP